MNGAHGRNRGPSAAPEDDWESPGDRPSERNLLLGGRTVSNKATKAAFPRRGVAVCGTSLSFTTVQERLKHPRPSGRDRPAVDAFLRPMPWTAPRIVIILHDRKV
jgi:hypothetical protein